MLHQFTIRFRAGTAAIAAAWALSVTLAITITIRPGNGVLYVWAMLAIGTAATITCTTTVARHMTMARAFALGVEAGRMTPSEQIVSVIPRPRDMTRT